MTETWNAATLAGIGYYGRNLDFCNFGRKWLLWSELGWPELGQLCAQNLCQLFFFFFFFFFFLTIDNWVCGICW